MKDTNASIGEFDLNDAIDRTSTAAGLDRKTTKIVVDQFLKELENGLAEHGRVELHGHFSITLKRRSPRSGTLKGKPWVTPERVEPEFQAFDRLKKLIQEKQGFPCV